MLNRDYASITAQIAKANQPEIKIMNQPNYLDMLKNEYEDSFKFDKLRKEQEKANEQDAYLDALRGAYASGDQEAIDKAYQQYDPVGYTQATNANQYNLALQQLKNEKGSDLTSSAKNYQYLRAMGLGDQEAMAIAFGGNTEAVGGALASGSLGGKGMSAYDKQMGKTLAEKESARQDFEALRPQAEQAIARAEQALDNGTGLGAVMGNLGKIGIASEKGALTQADINSANSQMNAILRQKLASTGLTGSELNSAVEAQAYRYTIDPSMPPAYIERQIQNFKDDYLGKKTPQTRSREQYLKWGIQL